MNLDFAKLCGKHSAIYEAYYKQMDPKGVGIEAMAAAKFLKKSGLSDVVLSRVWDLSDPNGKGFLDKPGFFIALKLVSLAQAGHVYNMNNIYMDTEKPPKVGDLPKIVPPRIQTAQVASTGDWSISVIDRLKYEQLFESLKPVAGMLAGNKVKGVLMDSKLPMETLGKIWDLADQDKDGNLDKHEFIVAMHLVYQTLEKRTVPDVLPPELRKTVGSGPPPKPAPPTVSAMPRAPSAEGFGDGGFVANFPKDIAPPPAMPLPITIPPMTRVPPVGGPATVAPLISTDPLIPIGAPPSVTANADWVVTPTDLKRFEIMFRDSDRDKDGLVSGLEVKNIFLQSGVPQKMLAHIWALCDTNQSGKLTLEQFALAMWLVERKQKGIDPPQVLTANMVPPSMRAIVAGVDLQPQEPKPTYTNPELEMISKEIEELAKERRALETEIAQKEADIRIKSGEVRSLQSELDTLSATLKQLEHQRGEAQKRLDDLKTQVNKIRDQCQKQEETINEQEGELNAKRSELQKLKDEENSLQKEYDDNNRELQKLTNHLQNTQLQISSIRSMVTQLLETQRQMTDALLMCKAAIDAENAELVSEYQLKIEPDFDDARKTLEKEVEEIKPDPFNENESADKKNGITSNGFDNDPFAGNITNNTGVRGGFDESFNTTTGFSSGFDAFGSAGGFGQEQKDPFGGDVFSSKTNSVTTEPGKDSFGSDPFAALHAPTGQGQVLSPNTQTTQSTVTTSKSGPPPRPESPSPALPPKKSKVPPPRPAPPRPLQAPARPAQPTADAFGSSGGTGGFADFADFDNKAPTLPSITLAKTSIATIPTMSLFDKLTKTQATTTATTTTTTTTISTSDFTTSLQQNSNASNSDVSNSNVINKKSATMTTTKTIIATNAVMATVATVHPIADNNNKSNAMKAMPSLISGPTDFKDDPFKDYRYEDPFNIKDPFDDDEDEFSTDPDKVFKDDLSSEEDEKKQTNNNNTTQDSMQMNADSSSTSQHTFRSANSHPSAGSNELIDQFDAFNMNPSPVPSYDSIRSKSVIALPIATTATTTATATATRTRITSGTNSVFDNFADFEGFSIKSTSAMDPSTTIKNRWTDNQTSDSFFDAFNDNFDTKSLQSLDANSNQKKNSTKSLNAFDDAFGLMGEMSSGKIQITNFDAFGDNFNKKSQQVAPALFDAFNDNNFEDDFFTTSKDISKAAIKDKNLNFTLNNKINSAFSIKNDDKFAKFDDFELCNNDSDMASADTPTPTNLNNSQKCSTSKMFDNLIKVQNRTMLTKISNLDKINAEANGAKLSEKFADDYSKPETFDDDIQEAIKRSMLDQ
ncbi:epidermal growth factor receptor pathway substrate 15 isoform 1-T1 [Glossina fuscipes fuscipes]